MVHEQSRRFGENRNYIRELSAFGNARAAVIGKENVLDFSIGNPSVPAPPQIEAAIRQILSDTDSLAIHSYTSATGDPETKAAIARNLSRRFGLTVTPEELFIGCGSASELTAVFRALAFDGAQILAIAPYFPEYMPFVSQSGATFRVVPPDIPDFQIRFDALEDMLCAETCAVILNCPNNPAGTVYTAQTLRRLSDLLTRKAEQYGHPIYLVSDEPYRELTYDGVTAPFIPLYYRDTIVCYSYSKSFSLPGERIGYIYVPKTLTDFTDVFHAIRGAARAMGHICAPTLWQKVIARCADVTPDFTVYEENRKLLYEGLQSAGYTVAKPEGAFYLFVQSPDGDGRAFAERAKQRDLLIVPGDDFGCPSYVRICYCVPREKIEKSLPVFRDLIKSSK